MKYARFPFCLSIGFFAISTAAAGVAAWGSGLLKSRVILYAVGGSFWLFLLAGAVLQFALAAKGRKSAGRPSGRPGWTRLFCNRPAGVFEILFMLSLAGNILIAVFWLNIKWLSVTLIVVLLFSGEMHCVFSSKNFVQIFFINEGKGQRKTA